MKKLLCILLSMALLLSCLPLGAVAAPPEITADPVPVCKCTQLCTVNGESVVTSGGCNLCMDGVEYCRFYNTLPPVAESYPEGGAGDDDNSEDVEIAGGIEGVLKDSRIRLGTGASEDLYQKLGKENLTIDMGKLDADSVTFRRPDVDWHWASNYLEFCGRGSTSSMLLTSFAKLSGEDIGNLWLAARGQSMTVGMDTLSTKEALALMRALGYGNYGEFLGGFNWSVTSAGQPVDFSGTIETETKYSREDVAQMLWRYLGQPTASSDKIRFSTTGGVGVVDGNGKFVKLGQIKLLQANADGSVSNAPVDLKIKGGILEVSGALTVNSDCIVTFGKAQ